MPRVATLPLAASACLCTVLRSQAPLGGRFAFVRTDSVAVHRFSINMSACEKETPAFAALLRTIADSQPLTAQAVDSSVSILFGSTSDSQTDEPLLAIDLRDIEKLPTRSEVQTWSADSSWALTRCEILAHELAETIVYREEWQKRPPGETLREANALYVARMQRAHLAGLDAEHEIALAQRTRRGPDGAPYSRTRECFRDRAVHIVFGQHTETIVLGDWTVARFVYYPNRNMCAAP